MQLGYGKPANQMDKFHYHRLWKMKHIFENLVLRDLLVFAGAHNARILHHADDTGIEADAVYQMKDGRYALIEIKTGVNKIPETEKSLLKFRDVIRKHNEEAKKILNILGQYIESHPYLS
jgi:hypothetical protein